MAVAFDNTSESHSGTTGSASESSFSWSHINVGAPRGLSVLVFTNDAADLGTAVDVNGIALTAVSGGYAEDTAGEAGSVRLWHLGSSVPTGTVTITVTRTNNATVMYAVGVSVTASTDTEVYAPGIVLLQGDGTLAEQSVTDGSPGTNSLRFCGVNSGLDSVPTAGANSSISRGIDFGTRTIQCARETTVGQGSRSIGLSSGTSEDRAGVFFAIREVVGHTPLTATQQSYTATAQAANLVVARLLTTVQQSYTATTQAATLTVARLLTAAQESYTATLQDAGVRAARLLTAAQESYTATLQAAGLVRGYQLAAASQTYVVAGQDAGTLAARRLAATQASYSTTGQASTLLVARQLSGAAQSYGLTLLDAGLTLEGAQVLLATQQSYALTLGDAGLRVDRRLAPAVGTVVLTGEAVQWGWSRRITAATASYALTGVAAGLTLAGGAVLGVLWAVVDRSPHVQIQTRRGSVVLMPRSASVTVAERTPTLKVIPVT